MKIKPLLCAAVMAVSCVVLPSTAQAETTYASPSELITDAIEVALSGVESSTYDTAIANMQSLITVSGNDVSYDGSVIGYWDSTASDVLYKDSSMTDKILYNDGEDIWRFEPTILSEILEDVNNDLIETIVPTTTDWNKIIGRYDVTLGTTTIPADQWIPLDPIVYDSENKLANTTKLSTYWEYDTSKLFYSSSDDSKNNSIFIVNYAINPEGELFFTNNILFLSRESGERVWYGGRYSSTSHLGNSGNYSYVRGDWYRDAELDELNTIRVGLYLIGADADDTSMTRIETKVFVSTADGTYVSNSVDGLNDYDALISISDAAITNTEEITDDWQVGVAVGYSNNHPYKSEACYQTFNKFFTTTPQSSKQQIGNTLLKRRLSKFSSLVEGDTIEVSPTAWTVYGLGGEETDFDTFLADQNMINPGDTADISAVADVEALGFSVILPTTLPIYVDELNQVSVATNATVENKSGAAVELQTIEIQAKPGTGWTLITDGEPSKKRDDKEFTFTTSLTDGIILGTGEIKPFSYDAKLSPLTEGVESLDLASVLVTVDWAPEE